ncbi:hypothetical protein AX17_005223 [Amanita inopinata Kibby_2008]|nr:hypothetical protein AX17_005223 [Amanita inopinata Kibby_2008]
MRLGSFLTATLPLTFALIVNGQGLSQERAEDGYRRTCGQINAATSSASGVFYPGQAKYLKDITTWASTNTQLAACSVEPGSSEDVSVILKILGKTRTPFAVKGGGHSPNPGFTSTKGVLISMSRFSEVTYDAASKTAVIGTGLIWDDVYAALEPHNVSVLGGRVSGVGVAGFVLGGGYSWKTNQFGLALDSVTAYELVKPDGEVIAVTHGSHPDLFFGLKGGFNNFGIVTKFTMKTFAQTAVWGGITTHQEDTIPDIKAAVSEFVDNVHDPKASIITAFNAVHGQVFIAQLMFYDGPTPPPGIFDAFLKIPSINEDVSRRSLLSLVQSAPAHLTNGQRNGFDTAPIQEYSPRVIDAVVNETIFWGNELNDKTATIITYAIEPFSPSTLNHNISASAYPPDRAQVLSPFDISYAWLSPAHDKDFNDAARQSAAHLRHVAIEDGQTAVRSGTLYPNYAAADTPLDLMYGDNVPRLRALKRKVDPDNVMGLAGGFKF